MFKKLKIILLSTLLTININANELPKTINSPNESYTVVRSLGEGVFGQVFEATNSQGEKFAIKWYKPQGDLEGTWVYLADAKREFGIGQTLNHPSIIRSIDYFSVDDEEDGESHYVVLEFVEGNTFFNLKEKSLLQEKVIDPSIELVEGLRSAFNQGLMHVDLHRNNVMLSHDNKVKIIDISSFLTFPEIYNFEETESEEKTQQSLESLALDSSFSKKRHEKLKNFFAENPDLRQKLHALKNKDALQPLDKRPKPGTETYQVLKKYFYIRYLDIITNGCVSLIKKSDFPRDIEMALRAKIKTLAWEFEKDFDEGIDEPADYYFDRLINLLESLKQHEALIS